MLYFTKLLHYKNKIYILFDRAVKNELIKLHYDDALT